MSNSSGTQKNWFSSFVQSSFDRCLTSFVTDHDNNNKKSSSTISNSTVKDNGLFTTRRESTVTVDKTIWYKIHVDLNYFFKDGGQTRTMSLDIIINDGRNQNFIKIHSQKKKKKIKII